MLSEMTDDSIADEPEYWRARAEEARMRAELFRDHQSRMTMMTIAKAYAALAEGIERKRRELPARCD
jgi:hypothetical protein